MDNIAADEWLPVCIDLMREGKQLKISPTGFSMYPFIIGDRDEVLLEIPKRALKRRDIILYRRDCGTYVLHRIHHTKCKKGITTYYLVGDSQPYLEGPIREEQVLALSVGIYRDGKLINYHSIIYNLGIELWLIIYRFRRIIIKFELRFQYHILKRKLPDILKDHYM